MAGLLFPDIAGALSSGAQAGAASAQGRFLMEDRAAKNEIAPLIPRALQGDKEALNQIGARHPDTFAKILPQLDRLDANKRAKVKEDAEYITSSGMAILSAPPEQQPQLYARVRQEAAAAGRDVSNWPTTYDPGWIKFNVDKARPFADYFKDRSEGFELVPSGGGGGGGGAAPPNRDAFVQTMMPHALEVSKATGLDPRLVIAQAALETGYGQSAPGNNLFGIKSHGKPGGQVLATKEAGPGGMYGTRESFRTYSNPGESARDYVDFLKTNSRYAPVFQAQGIDAQIEAMGRSGYASDPQYAAKLRQIVQSLPQPPGLAQGSDMPPADASGNPIQTSDGGAVPRDAMRMITPNLPPGTFIGRDRKTGKFIVQEGNFVVYDANKNPVGMIPVPKAQGAGPFTGSSVEAQALNMLIANGTLTPQQAADLAAGKTITDPKTGQIMFATPTGLMTQPPGQASQPVGAPGASSPAGGAAVPAAPAGMIPITGPKTPEAVKKFTAEAMAVNSAIDNFNAVLKEAGGGTFSAFLNNSRDPQAQKINGAFNALKTALRSEAFVNTGVLQPAEMQMLDNMLLAPTTVRGLLATPEAYGAMLDQIKQFVNGKMTSVQSAYGQPVTGLPGAAPQAAPAPTSAPVSAAPAPPKVGDVVDGYRFKGGNPADQNNWSKQ